MRYSLGCRLGYRVTEPTSFVFNVEVARIPQQRVLHERLVVTPEVPLETYVMPESGNRYVRLLAQPGPILLSYEAEVDLLVHRADPATVGETPLAELAFEVLPHLYPSRYCQSDRLERAAQSDFGQTERGHARVTALCNWIYEWIDYSRGTSDAHTSACDTLIDRAGVCRDFAHLGIALCRALGDPGPVRQCLCLPAAAAGLPCRVRGLDRRPLVSVRPDPAGGTGRDRADRGRPGRVGGFVRQHPRWSRAHGDGGADRGG